MSYIYNYLNFIRLFRTALMDVWILIEAGWIIKMDLDRPMESIGWVKLDFCCIFFKIMLVASMFNGERLIWN